MKPGRIQTTDQAVVFSSHIFLFYFLPIALVLYYLSPRALQHFMLTALSYVFYGWWSPWFTLLMLGSTVVDYWCGRQITAPGATERRRKTALWTSIAVNLGVLAVFKYTTFLVHTASGMSVWMGFGEIEAADFFYRIVLPLGISFYTFQSMSYSIDLYRGHARPAPNFITFACYVSLYPQLVAGPIVRYGSVAEQLHHRIHSWEKFVHGFTRFNFGFAKKILLANPMGAIADSCFGAGDGVLTTTTAWIGVTAYAFQIYLDFSAYSDMAIGLGRMLGFHFPENFNSPYKSKSITEFWRRWHISLSSFLRDYLYIPLGGNRRGVSRTYLNLMVVMVLGGLWHGAQWTFVVWGLIHGAMLAAERMLGKDSFYARLPGFIRVALTFVVVLITWVFFRSPSFEHAGRYLAAMFGFSGHSPAAGLLTAEIMRPYNLVCFVICAYAVWGMPRVAAILQPMTLPKAITGLLLLVAAVGMMFTQGFNPFIYFQF